MIDRLNMVKLAIKGNPKFDVSDIEYKSDKTSYTYNTISALKNIFNKERFSFLIGSDAFEHIESWYNSQKLKELLNFIVVPCEHSINKSWLENLKQKGYNFDFINLKFCDISSTEV